MKKTQIQVRSLAINSKNISRQNIDGVDHIVIRGVVPIVDDIVMNGGLYPATEINNSYQSIEGNLMPMSHPVIDGQSVSAHSPRAINLFHVGAWAENVRKDGDRVVMDMKVNTVMANSSENGKRLVDRLESMMNDDNAEPIHISTGLLLNRTTNSGKSKGKKYTWVASNMQFDHVAILLDEPGAGTPKEGVGIFCNNDGSTEDLEIHRVNLVDGTNNVTDTWLQKVKYFFNSASGMSFDDISNAIYNKLQSVYPNDEFIYPSAVYPKTFIYTRKGSTFEQAYSIDASGECLMIGDPQEVVRDPTTYSPVSTNGEQDQMKTMIVNALKAAGKSVDGLSDEQLLSAYQALNAEGKPKPKPKMDADGNEIDDEGNIITPAPKVAGKPATASNNEQAPAWAVALGARLDRMEQAQNSAAESRIAQLRETVKAKTGFSDVVINSMNEEALKEMAAMNQPQAFGINAAFTGSAPATDICVQPE